MNLPVAPVFVITAKCDLRHKEGACRCVTSSNLWLPVSWLSVKWRSGVLRLC